MIAPKNKKINGYKCIKSDEIKIMEAESKRIDKDLGKLGEKTRGHDTFVEVQKKENHHIKESIKRIENNTDKLFNSQTNISESINVIKVSMAQIARNGDGKK